MSNIDLKEIFQLFRDKQFHHGSSQTNPKNGNLFMDFSTGSNGRGNYVEMRLGNESNDIEYWGGTANIKHTNITDEELIEFIKKDVK